MARRSNSESAGCALLLLGAFGFWAFDWVSKNPLAIYLGVGGAIVFALVAVLRYFLFRENVKTLIAHHKDALTTSRRQLTITTPYGSLDSSRWAREMEMFIRTEIEPEVGAVLKLTARARYVRELLDAATSDYAKSRTKFEIDMDPRAYEAMVADGLADIGWSTRLTKGSGDQGVDIVAEMREKRVVIQCKRYQSPIGNTAVQEAYAGRSFEDADYAAVVSNAGFTAGARQIADATRVILMHHDELHLLEEKIFETSEWRRHRERLRASAEARGMYSEALDALQPEPTKRNVVSEAAMILLGTTVLVVAVARWQQGRSLPEPVPAITPSETSPTETVAAAGTQASMKSMTDPMSAPVPDSNAAAKIALYCRQDDLKAEATCKSNERRAWYRVVIKHEFPDGVSEKCNAPPYPDSFTVKETCMKYEVGGQPPR